MKSKTYSKRDKFVGIEWWHNAKVLYDTAEMYEGTMDMEFESNRVRNEGVRVNPEDRTTIGGVPTEWLREPEVREMLLADGRLQEIPLEWLVALDQTDDIRNMR